MDINAVRPQLEHFHQAVSGVIPVAELIVFGSYLDGRATPDSDIDVLVISVAFQAMSEDERLRLLDRFGQRSTPVIEAWGFTPEEFATASPLTTLGHARAVGYRWAAGKGKAMFQSIYQLGGS
jgi:hypothetical protein